MDPGSLSHISHRRRVSNICGEMHTGKNVWEDSEPQSMSSPWLFVSFTWAAVVLCKEKKLWVHILSQVLSGAKKVSDVASSRLRHTQEPHLARAEVPGTRSSCGRLVWRIGDVPRAEETNSYPRAHLLYILLSVLKVHLCHWSLGWVCCV